MEKQASSLHCFVCGVENAVGLKMKFFTKEPGIVEANYTVSEQYQGYPGIVHGGVIASMLDEVMGRVFMQDEPPRFMVTAELKIRYRKPVPINTPLLLRGKGIKDNGRIATAVGEIIGPDGSTLVQGEITVANIPQAMVTSVDYEALGWKVYPD